MGKISKFILTTVLLLLVAVCNFALYAAPKVQNNEEENIDTIPVLLVEFQDVKFSLKNPIAQFSNMLGQKGYNRNGSAGCVAEYFNTNFRGEREFAFPIAAMVTLDNPISHYGAPGSTFNDTDIVQMLADACVKASDQEVDFQLFDTDNDGSIGNIAIIFAGYSESEGGSPNSIWSHQFNIEHEEFYVSQKKVLSFTCTPELQGNSDTIISPVGTFCHEIAHYLGLPDLYDTNGETEGLCDALRGTLSIMDRGNHSNKGNTPPYFNSIEREILGIGEIEDILPDTSYILSPVHLSGKIYRIKGAVEGEYFLLECRNPLKWDRFIGGGGLVVYHIDKSVREWGGIGSSLRWEYNNINTYAAHPCARVICANPSNNTPAGLFFPGSSNSTELSSGSNGAQLKDWNGEGCGVGLKNIRFSGGKIYFKTFEDYSFSTCLPKAIECRATPFQKEAIIVWEAGSDENMTLEGCRWIVKWNRKGENTFYSDTTSTCSIRLASLEPGCNYDVQIRCIKGMVLGKTTSTRFKTHHISSRFPYIYIADNHFEQDRKIELSLFNLPPDNKSVTWFIDGKKLDGYSYFPQGEGIIQIKASINYNDGTQENIYKEFMVE